jgi:SAM-dependent methyltransferase
VARTGVAPEPDAAPVEWHQAGAEALPLADAGFDVICCQLGLQFFVDRPTALHEMHRVLAPGGRLALMVWRSIDHSPGFAALLAALERPVGAAAAAVVRAPFSLSDDAELEALIRAAGFRDVTVERRAGTARFPSVEGFVRGYVGGSPLAGHMAQVSDAVREALVADVRAALAGHASDSGLEFPMAALLASARK